MNEGLLMTIITDMLFCLTIIAEHVILPNEELAANLKRIARMIKSLEEL